MYGIRPRSVRSNASIRCFIRAETALRVDLAVVLTTLKERDDARAHAMRADHLAVEIGSSRPAQDAVTLVVDSRVVVSSNASSLPERLPSWWLLSFAAVLVALGGRSIGYGYGYGCCRYGIGWGAGYGTGCWYGCGSPESCGAGAELPDTAPSRLATAANADAKAETARQWLSEASSAVLGHNKGAASPTRTSRVSNSGKTSGVFGALGVDLGRRLNRDHQGWRDFSRLARREATPTWPLRRFCGRCRSSGCLGRTRSSRRLG